MMHRITYSISLFLLVLSCFGQASLTLNIKGVKVNKGQMMIAVFDLEDHFLIKPVFSKKVKVGEIEELTYTFQQVPFGSYAVSIFHDLNANGKLDTNMLGIPTEPFAFSNNAKGTFGPPKFEDSVFSVSGNTAITISL